MHSRNTDNYNLPIFEPDDRVQVMADINPAMETIDKQLGVHRDSIHDMDNVLTEVSEKTDKVVSDLSELTEQVSSNTTAIDALKEWEEEAKSEIAENAEAVDALHHMTDVLDSKISDEVDRAKKAEQDLRDGIDAANLAAARAQNAAKAAEESATEAQQAVSMAASGVTQAKADAEQAKADAAEAKRMAQEAAETSGNYAGAIAEAQDKAQQAKSEADEAKKTADGIAETANEAKSKADEAYLLADSAQSASGRAADMASSAANDAKDAKTQAGEALTQSQAAETAAQAAQAIANAALQSIGQHVVYIDVKLGSQSSNVNVPIEIDSNKKAISVRIYEYGSAQTYTYLCDISLEPLYNKTLNDGDGIKYLHYALTKEVYVDPIQALMTKMYSFQFEITKSADGIIVKLHPVKLIEFFNGNTTIKVDAGSTVSYKIGVVYEGQ